MKTNYKTMVRLNNIKKLSMILFFCCISGLSVAQTGGVSGTDNDIWVVNRDNSNHDAWLRLQGDNAAWLFWYDQSSRNLDFGHSSSTDNKNKGNTLFRFKDEGEFLLLEDDGKIGVGTGNPDARVTIGGIGGNDNVKLLGFGEGNDSDFWFGSGFDPSDEENYIELHSDMGNAMTWKLDGRVGIGTTSPLHKLHVKGLSPTDDAVLFLEPSEWNSPGDHATIRFGDQHHFIRGEHTNGMTFHDIAKFAFTGGNVGIGTTNPLHKLHVKGLSPTDDAVLFLEPSEWNSPGDHATIRFGDQHHFIRGEHTNGMTFHDIAKFAFTGGNVGIGTTSPTEKLEVAGNVKATSFEGVLNPTTDINLNGHKLTGGGADGLFIAADGNVGIGIDNPSFAKVQIKGGATHEILAVTRPNSDTPAMYLGNDGTNNAVIAANNADLTFGRDLHSTYTEYMRIQNGTGNVGIGTTTPQSKLAVNGKITTREVEVTPDGWADFVFEDNYALPSLEEVEAHIDTYKHLPGVPSAKEVMDNGIELGKMNATLLQKIEELTLYVIELKKELDKVKGTK